MNADLVTLPHAVNLFGVGGGIISGNFHLSLRSWEHERRQRRCVIDHHGECGAFLKAFQVSTSHELIDLQGWI